jgi:hypothetical protein
MLAHMLQVLTALLACADGVDLHSSCGLMSNILLRLLACAALHGGSEPLGAHAPPRGGSVPLLVPKREPPILFACFACWVQCHCTVYSTPCICCVLHAAGFGQQRDPGAAKEEGGDMEARLVKGSDTSDKPADLSSG